MKSIIKFFILFTTVIDINSQNLKSPSDFLGYDIGTQFSRHSQVVDYFDHVSKEMNENILLINYGKTYERRPLFYAVISSKENIAEIESIRLNNLSALDVNENRSNDKAIVWLSYNVHGNESSSTEASMQTVYELLTRRAELLQNTVVIIDPCLNPDGRDRYANWYNQTKTSPYNTNKISREHIEPWPGGRANHYLFDLNRDWAWITQIESQQRLREYQKWMPHVHVDFHEQGINEPYYFAPAAEPYHEVITNWQRDFQFMIGKNNAKYFDENGWLYFTKEIFDLLYPSYGDTYPTYLGAIGMTYEQAGGGVAGLGILNSEDKNLTLVDRVKHHTVAGISTVEISSANSDRLNKEFVNFFKNKNKSTYYILNGDSDKIDQLSKFLKKHEIDFYSTKVQKLNAFNYNKNKITSYTTTTNDLIIPNSQAKGKLVDVFLERTTKLSDSMTYDITAWSLPFVYGVNAYSTSKKIETSEYKENKVENIIDEDAVAYASIWNHMNDAKFLSNLIENKIKVRYNEKIIRNGDLTLPRGSVIIYKGDQTDLVYEKVLFELADKNNIKLHPIYSGMSEFGPDLGSDSVKLVKNKKIAIFSGEDGINRVSSLNYGAIWHFFEQELKYPLTHLNIDNFKNILNSDSFLSTIVELDLDGNKQKVLPREVSYHVVSDEPIHIDFMRIVSGSKIVIEIPVQFKNNADCPGLKKGGVLNIVRRKVELKCPADKIPESLVVDLAGLDIGSSIKISSVNLLEISCNPKGLLFLLSPAGIEIAGKPAKLEGTVKTSFKYIFIGSSFFSPSTNASLGAVGLRITSTFLNAELKSSTIFLLTF